MCYSARLGRGGGDWFIILQLRVKECLFLDFFNFAQYLLKASCHIDRNSSSQNMQNRIVKDRLKSPHNRADQEKYKSSCLRISHFIPIKICYGNQFYSSFQAKTRIETNVTSFRSTSLPSVTLGILLCLVQSFEKESLK